MDLSIQIVSDTTALQFTVSNRGSLQIILNRYMYLTHHKAHGGRKRRWRCIDYRRLHCPAFVDTDGDSVVKRKYMHSHPFHDIKILKKIQRNLVYSSTAKALSILNATQKHDGNTCNEDNIMDESD
ncbi:unnamed protein product [Parnassius mnemosyne]|uniref:FLYWCH-type domain-containing protein n=1 Tax=Parnassius mnemosyne TaxID=213953 RepID=A0AAV1M1C1_9NEOP